MVWPLPTFPTDRTNDTDQLDLHPADHNAMADALNELNRRTALLYTGIWEPVTLQGMAVGTGGSALNRGRATYVGPRPFTAGAGAERGLLYFSGRLVFGSAGQTFPGAGNEGLFFNSGDGPFTFFLDRDPTYVNTPIGRANYNIGGANYDGAVWWTGETSVRFVASVVAGSAINAADLTATFPGTWAAGSAINYSFACGAILQ